MIMRLSQFPPVIESYGDHSQFGRPERSGMLNDEPLQKVSWRSTKPFHRTPLQAICHPPLAEFYWLECCRNPFE